jgi:hypothetical protein
LIRQSIGQLTRTVGLVGLTMARNGKDRTVTRKGDDSAWNAFVAWCRKRGLHPMPANPWTVAAYARWCERHQRYPAIIKTIRAIARMHRSKSRQRPDRDPTVARTIRLIETRARVRPKKKGTGLFPEADILGGAAGAPRKVGVVGKGKIRGAAKPASRRGLSAQPKLVSRHKLKK